MQQPPRLGLALDERARLRAALFDAAPAMLALKDLSGAYQAANPAFCAYLGRDEVDIVGVTDRDLLRPEVAACAAVEDAEVVSSGKPLLGLRPEPSGDGTRWFHQAKAPFHLADGSIGGVLVCWRDVTVELAAEAKLRTLARQARGIVTIAVVHGAPGWRERALDPEADGEPFVWQIETLDDDSAREVLALDLAPGETYVEAWERSRSKADHRQAQLNAAEAFFHGRDSYRNEWRCTDCDGVEHWQQQLASVQALGESCWRVTAFTTDITALKRAEEQRLGSEEVLRSAKEIAGLGVFDYDMVAGVYACDERAQELWGLAPGDEVSEAVIGDRTHPDDVAAVQAAVARAVAAGGGDYVIDYRIRRPDGTINWVAARGRVFVEDGKPVRRLGTMVDITPRQHAEEELRAVLTNARCILWHAEVTGLPGWREADEHDWNVLDWDLRVEDEIAAQLVLPLEMSGRTAYPEAWIAARVDEDRGPMVATAAHAFRLGLKGYSQDFRCRDRDHRLVWLHEEATIQPMGPDRWRVVGVVIDVTERRAAEEERLQLERRVQQSQRLESLGVLAGGIAHDFNNLLAIIMGNADLAEEASSSSTATARYLGDIRTATQRAAELCQQMLSYAGRGQTAAATLDLGALAAELTQLLRASISKRAVLQLELPDAPLTVHGDAAQLRQVLMNLVVNAAEALSGEDGVISVRAAAVTCRADELAGLTGADDLPGGAYVLLEVCDTGRGIAAVDLPRVFEPFYTTKFTGRGLGLAAIVGIVRSHRGAMTVSSTPGEGATFRLYLPAVEAAPRTADAASGDSARQPVTVNGTVLLVDDEPAVRETARRMLLSFGLQVVCAADGVEAVDRYRERHAEIGAVLLDLTMPRMDGEEAFHRLCEIDPDVRVIIGSGYGAAGLSGRVGGASLVGILQKPYSLAALRELLVPLFVAPGISG